MKKYFLVIGLYFLFGCQNNSSEKKVNDQNQVSKETSKKKKVTGVGGIFFKAKDTKKLKEWYAQHLGLVTDEYGSLFETRDADKPELKRYLQWSPFKDSTKYFEPSQKEFMVNFRVENIEGLLMELKQNGVTVLDTIEHYEYGNFVHIMDLEGNKIELWEPIESEFTKNYEGKTTK